MCPLPRRAGRARCRRCAASRRRTRRGRARDPRLPQARATSSAGCGAPPTVRARSSRPARRPRRRSRPPIARPGDPLRHRAGRRPSREARRWRRSSSPASAPRTSSGRSISARPAHVLAQRAPAGGCSRSRSWSARSGRWHGGGSGCSRRAACTSRSAGSCARTSSATRRGRCCRRRSAATRRASTRPCAATRARAAPPPGRCCSSARSAASRRSCSPPSGFALAVGRYDVGGYLWVELAFVVGAAVLAGVVLFSTRLRPLLQRAAAAAAPRADRAAAARGVPRACTRSAATRRCSSRCSALTLVVQAVRVLAIWCAGKAVGVDLSPRPYYVMGPLLFLVMLVPFTVNGLAVRESFFVSFLGALGVGRRPRVRDRLPVLRRHDRARAPGCRDRAARGSAAAAMSDVSVVVVTYNGLPWLEQALDSVRGHETVVVDHGSSDGTVEFVRDRFPDVSSSSRRTAASPSAGTPGSRTRPAATSCCSTPTRGWTRARSTRSSRSPTRSLDAAVVGPRLRYPDGRASALGARLPDALADRDGVPLPAQARAEHPRPQRVLCGWVRPRRRFATPRW